MTIIEQHMTAFPLFLNTLLNFLDFLCVATWATVWNTLNCTSLN